MAEKMGENEWKWVKMVQTRIKWIAPLGNEAKCSVSLGNEAKWKKMEENGDEIDTCEMIGKYYMLFLLPIGWKSFFSTYSLKKRIRKTAENGRKWAEMKKNGWKWVKMDENERKWFSFISGHFGPFSIILLHLLKEVCHFI